MALALDAKTQFAGDDTDVSSLTWQHTCAGTDRVLIVRVQGADPNPVNISSVTYNGVAATRIDAAASQRDFGAYSFFVEFWRLLAPATGGAFDIVVTPAAECEVLTGGASSWAGADRSSNVIRGAQTASSASSGSAVSLAIASAVGDVGIDAACAGNNWDPSEGANQTLLHKGTSGVAGGTGFQIDHGSSYEAGASSVTMSWSNGGANSVGWVQSAISIRPANDIVVTPSVAALTLTAFAPNIEIGSDIEVIPSPATLTTTPFAPMVPTPRLVTPPLATLTLTAFAPRIDLKVIPAPAGLATEALAPIVATPRTVEPAAAQLALTAASPTVTASNHQAVTPSAATLAITPFAPSITVSEQLIVTPSTAALLLTTFQPAVAIAYLSIIDLIGVSDPTVALAGQSDGAIAETGEKNAGIALSIEEPGGIGSTGRKQATIALEGRR